MSVQVTTYRCIIGEFRLTGHRPCGRDHVEEYIFIHVNKFKPLLFAHFKKKM